MDNPNIQTFREYVICARNNALAFLRDFSARKVFHDMYVVHTFFLALHTTISRVFFSLFLQHFLSATLKNLVGDSQSGFYP